MSGGSYITYQNYKLIYRYVTIHLPLIRYHKNQIIANNGKGTCVFCNKFERNVFLIAPSARRQGHQLQSRARNESYRSFERHSDDLVKIMF